MTSLLSKKLTYMEVGYMLGSLIVIGLGLIIVSMSMGMVLGKLLWSPPERNNNG